MDSKILNCRDTNILSPLVSPAKIASVNCYSTPEVNSNCSSIAKTDLQDKIEKEKLSPLVSSLKITSVNSSPPTRITSDYSEIVKSDQDNTEKILSPLISPVKITSVNSSPSSQISSDCSVIVKIDQQEIIKKKMDIPIESPVFNDPLAGLDDNNEETRTVRKNVEEKVLVRRQKVQSVAYVCQPCKVEICGVVYQHLKGRKHTNCALFEVVKNPSQVASCLKSNIPDIIIGAVCSRQVLAVSSSYFKCQRCEKVLNGIKTLTHHLETHRARGEMLSMVDNIAAAVNDTTVPEILSPLLSRGKVLILDFCFLTERRGLQNIPAKDDVKELTSFLSHLGYKIEYEEHSQLETVWAAVNRIRATENFADTRCLICVIIGPGVNKRLITSNGEVVDLFEIMTMLNDRNFPQLEGRIKIFIADIYYSNCANAVVANQPQERKEPTTADDISKNTVSLVATSGSDRTTNFIKNMIKCIRLQPQINLGELYLKLCDNFANSSDRIEYHNYEATQFSFI